MKKLIPLFFIFAFITIYSQEYHFDYYVKYKHELKRKKHNPELLDFQYLINSKDHSYKTVFRSEHKNKLIAVITDFKNSIQHYFDLKNTVFPLKSEDFNYKYSMRMPSVKKQFEDESKRRFFKSEFIDKQNSGFSNYLINEFTDDKMKNPRFSADAVFADFKDDLSFVGLQLLFDYYEIYNKIKFQNNYILKSASGKFEDTEITLSLDAVESQDFDIKVIQSQLKFKNN